MKRIERLLLRGSAYSVLILTVFYVFALAAKFTSSSLGADKFFVCLGFGMLISFMEFVYESLSVNKLLRFIIHYAVLLFAFSVIFVVMGNIKSSGAGAIFIAVFIFTALYLLMYLTVHYSGKVISAADKRLDRSAQRKAKQNEVNKKGRKNAGNEEYTSRFS